MIARGCLSATKAQQLTDSSRPSIALRRQLCTSSLSHPARRTTRTRTRSLRFGFGDCLLHSIKLVLPLQNIVAERIEATKNAFALRVALLGNAQKKFPLPARRMRAKEEVMLTNLVRIDHVIVCQARDDFFDRLRHCTRAQEGVIYCETRHKSPMPFSLESCCSSSLSENTVFCKRVELRAETCCLRFCTFSKKNSIARLHFSSNDRPFFIISQSSAGRICTGTR